MARHIQNNTAWYGKISFFLGLSLVHMQNWSELDVHGSMTNKLRSFIEICVAFGD